MNCHFPWCVKKAFDLQIGMSERGRAKGWKYIMETRWWVRVAHSVTHEPFARKKYENKVVSVWLAVNVKEQMVVHIGLAEE